MAGQLATFATALVALERTIDPAFTVYMWRPVAIQPPAIYNWVLPSPSDVPAIGVVVDTMNIAVRIVVATSDIDVEEAATVGYFDSARDVIDTDLVFPHKSTLRGASQETRRTTMRTLTDEFNGIPYMALELVIQADFRRYFTPS